MIKTYKNKIFLFYKCIILINFIYIDFNFIFINEKISVIIPTYNRANLIKKSINSVLNQTYKNIEIIVIDDGSTDSTQSIINKINDKRIKYYKLNKNNGASYARNVGINLASGNYISFHDSDDILNNQKLEKQFKNLKKNKSKFDFCKFSIHINNNINIIFPNNQSEEKILNNQIYDELLNKGNFITTQSILIKKSYIKKYLFDINLPRLQDYDLVLRIIPNVKLSYTNEILLDIYHQNDSISNSPLKIKKAILILLKKNYNLNSFQKKNFTKYLKELEGSLKENKTFSDKV